MLSEEFQFSSRVGQAVCASFSSDCLSRSSPRYTCTQWYSQSANKCYPRFPVLESRIIVRLVLPPVLMGEQLVLLLVNHRWPT